MGENSTSGDGGFQGGLPAHNGFDKQSREAKVDAFIDTNPKRISWDHAQKIGVARGRKGSFKDGAVRECVYRPFTKQWLYFDRFFNNRVYQLPRIFPSPTAENRVIWCVGVGATIDFGCFISDKTPDLQGPAKVQCFPLYLYDDPSESDIEEPGLFSTGAGELARKDAITSAGLAHFQSAYPGEEIGKEDVFYYVYGLLHSPEYRERYADNLSKELPRIPRLKEGADFWAFSKAGRALADLHLGYESVEPYVLTIEAKGTLTDSDYRVEKMKFAKKGDKTSIIYNHRITLKGIPEDAWNYVVNGKAALDWVMERQSIKTEKDSGIVNDANNWAIETIGNPRYPLELFQRVVTVSLETMRIIRSLPSLSIMDE